MDGGWMHLTLAARFKRLSDYHVGTLSSDILSLEMLDEKDLELDLKRVCSLEDWLASVASRECLMKEILEEDPKWLACRFAEARLKKKQVTDKLQLVRNRRIRCKAEPRTTEATSKCGNEHKLATEKLIRKRKQATDNDLIRLERTKRDRKSAELANPEGAGRAAATGCREVLLAAREKLEAWKESGGVEGMNLEELDGLGSCAMAVFQLAEKEKESVRKREQEREVRNAKDAAVAAELRRLEEDNAKLRENLAIEQAAVVNQRNQVLELEANRNTLRQDLEAQQEKSMCTMCFEKARNTVVLPCSHFLFCNSCMLRHRDQITTCPTCRGPITGSMALCVP